MRFWGEVTFSPVFRRLVERELQSGCKLVDSTLRGNKAHKEPTNGEIRGIRPLLGSLETGRREWIRCTGASSRSGRHADLFRQWAPAAMSQSVELIQGEFRRTLDERYRLSLPSEMAAALSGNGRECILAKERAGCLSLWNEPRWTARLDAGVQLVESKIRAGKLEGRVGELQRFGRLLSTRHRPVKLAGRGRLVVPEGFREFLEVEPGGELFVVGAAVCVELWNPQRWLAYLQRRMPRFERLFDRLSS